MLGHAIVQLWTCLAVDRCVFFFFNQASTITVCIYFEREYICVFLHRRTMLRTRSTGSVGYFPRQIKSSYCLLFTAKFLPYQLNIKY